VKRHLRVISAWIGGAVLLSAGLAFWCFRGSTETPDRLLRQARRAMDRAEYARGEELAKRILTQAPRDG